MTGSRVDLKPLLLACLLVGCAAAPPPQTDSLVSPTTETTETTEQRPEPFYGGPARPLRGSEVLHRVSVGDRLAAVAELYDLSAMQLARANGLGVADRLFVGEFLIVPLPRRQGSSVFEAERPTAPAERLETESLPEPL